MGMSIDELADTYTPNGTTVTYKVTFALPANDTNRIIRYEAYQGSTLVGAFTTGPGDPSSQVTLYGLATNTAVSLKEVVSNLVIDSDGTAHFDSSTLVRTVNGGTTPVTDTSTTTPGTVTAPGATTSSGVAPSANTTTNNYNSSVIWSSPSGAPTVGGSTQAVTDSLFKEGTEKVVTAVNAVKNDTGVVRSFAEAQNTLRDASPTTSAMLAEGNTQKDAIVSAMTRTALSFGSIPTQSSPAILVLHLPVLGTINLDPATHTDIKEYLDFVKLLFGWYLIFQFHCWCWAEFKSLQLATFTFTQAKGNPVLGGTGAQATGFAAAIAITVILVAIPSAYWAYATSDNVSALSTNPFSSTTGITGAGLYLLSLCCPYQLILLLTAEMLVVRKAGVTALAGANIVIKHITP